MDALENTTATGESVTEMNVEEGFNTTASVIQRSAFADMFITSFFLTWGPGIISNTLAMFFLVLDLKQISMPLLVLLLTLVFSNLLAVIFSLIRHLLGVYVVPTFNLCAAITFLHSFFKLTAGSVNTMMAADRVLAIYAPFFYDRRITVNTWKAGCAIAVTLTSFCSALPWFGLGNVISVGKDGSLVCTGFYGEVPRHKVFPFTFSLFGATFILVIVCCNAALVRGLLKLNRSVVVLTDRAPTSTTPIDVTESSGNSATSRSDTKMAFEVAFAKLMFCMATAYLICGSPNYILVFLEQMDVEIIPGLTGIVHFLGGILYTIDPTVYILLRRRNRKRIVQFFRKLFRRAGSSTRSSKPAHSRGSLNHSNPAQEKH